MLQNKTKIGLKTSWTSFYAEIAVDITTQNKIREDIKLIKMNPTKTGLKHMCPDTITIAIR